MSNEERPARTEAENELKPMAPTSSQTIGNTIVSRRFVQPQLKVKLIRDNGQQRFYQLSHKLTKGISVLRGKEIDLIEALSVSKEKDFKPEFKHLCPTDGVDIICVSDAHTHLERLVFAAIKWDNDEIGRTRVQIDGCHTFMIHGGSKAAMKPDYVYLRRLAKVNGLQFHLSNFQGVSANGG